MKSITYVGLDVHKNSFTVCCYQPKVVKDRDDKADYHHRMNPDYKKLRLFGSTSKTWKTIKS